jgi:hypothetical protein
MDAVRALALLLTDAPRRAQFATDRGAVLDALGVPAPERPMLLAVDVAELEVQAAGLIAKRRHEVAERIPRTAAALGCRFTGLFDAYAVQHWPEGAGRHPRDAHAFCAWLRDHAGVAPDRGEWNRLRFLHGTARRACHWVWRAPVGRPGGRGRPALQWLSRGREGAVRVRWWYVGL